MQIKATEPTDNPNSINKYQQFPQFRKSIGSLPFRKVQIFQPNTTHLITTRRPSLGKTQKRISIKRNLQTNPINTVKNIGDKSTYFDQFLSDFSILKEYKLMSHIGKGCFSTVSLAIHRQSHSPFALKTYEKIDSLEWYRLQGIRRQIKHLKNLNHPNVVALKHVFKDKKKILILMQNGGKQSLSGLLRKNKIFSERLTKFYLKQIVSAMSYCHEKGVCHRDLKPENILVDENGNTKIIDFGFSATSKNKLKVFCGTPPFMSPEITKKVPYNGAAADIWALGIMIYQMMVGKLPFRATNEPELYRIIQQGKYPQNDYISSKPLKNVLDKMLKVNPEERITASQLLQESWFK